MFKALHAGISDKGMVRHNNEDAWAASPKYGIYLVSDGMGGEFAGEMASQIVASTIPPCMERLIDGLPKSDANDLACMAHSAICHLSSRLRIETRGRPGLDGMGATVVMIMLKGDSAILTHMGDSRAYLLRDDKLSRLTSDHSVLQFLLHTGSITMKEAKDHPAKGQLMRCVGMHGEPQPDSSIFKLKDGDRILLCSDGLTDMLSDHHIKSILSSKTSLQAICKRFTAAANKAGGRDNITALIVDFRETISVPSKARTRKRSPISPRKQYPRKP